jgi:RNA polymerase sigma-70 factor (ECF subfamily)
MEPVAATGLLDSAADNPTNPTGEMQDFDSVVQRYWPRVLRFLIAAVQDSDLAESLTQDCFLKAYRNRSSFRGDSSLNTWLMSIAVNLARDHARNRRFQFWRKAERTAVAPEHTQEWLPDRKISPEQKALLNEQIQEIWNATKDLSERQRTVFLLRFVEDLDILEIAEATGLSESAVNVHLFRAVRSIRKRVRNPQ